MSCLSQQRFSLIVGILQSTLKFSYVLLDFTLAAATLYSVVCRFEFWTHAHVSHMFDVGCENGIIHASPGSPSKTSANVEQNISDTCVPNSYHWYSPFSSSLLVSCSQIRHTDSSSSASGYHLWWRSRGSLRGCRRCTGSSAQDWSHLNFGS